MKKVYNIFEISLSFKEWLLNENTTTQMLKMKAKNFPKIKSNIKKAQSYIQGKLDQLDDESANLLAKWYVWRHLEEMGSGNDLDDFIPWLQAAFTTHRDYIAAQLDQSGSIKKIKSALNNPKYSLAKIGDDIDLWHEKLKAEAGSMPEKGSLFIDLGEELGEEWKGWEWIDLGKGYCDKEARAMGHCGNTGAKPGDNILSLRDPKGRAHLTFILNSGKLGEMKGRSNTKPKKAYHPAIVALLRNDEIDYVVGGGYMPENNFSLDDLDDETKESLLEDKPDLEHGMDKQIEEIEERLQEIENEWNQKWDFAYANASVADYTEDIYIDSSGGWYLDISDWNVELPAYNERDFSRLKNRLDTELGRIDLIGEDFEIDDNSMRSYWNDDNVGNREDPEEFDAWCNWINDEIEPKKEKAIQIIKSVLVEEGYMKPSYSSQILGYGKHKDHDPSSNWDDLNFQHFSWDEGNEADDDEIGPHTVHVTLNSPIHLMGYTQSMPQNAVKIIQNDFVQSLKKEIHEMAKRQAALWNRQRPLPGFEKPNISAFSLDSMIHPEIYIRGFGDKIVMYIDFYFKISHGKEEIIESKKFIKFLDDNFNRFASLAQNMFQQKVDEHIKNFQTLQKGPVS